jgi:radical SAM protein (TIGR01212 family)
MSQEKRYNTFSSELKKRFGCKVQRISVDAGFTCPNRDGTLDTKGCIYCGGHGSGSYGIRRELSITGQIADGKDVMSRKYRALKYLAYFQPYSNTYASVEHLSRVYHEALGVPDVVGLVIATRPDCLPNDVLDLLAVINGQTYLWLEIGLQSVHDRNLTAINRRHDYACFVDAVKRAKLRNINVCAHIILGLPGESREEMLASTSEINRLGIDGVKLHLLHIMRGTRLAGLYYNGEVKVLERDDYAGLVSDYLELLQPRIMIHRLTGDGGHDNLIAPLWSLNKFELLNLIDSEMLQRGTFQGSRCQNSVGTY